MDEQAENMQTLLKLLAIITTGIGVILENAGLGDLLVVKWRLVMGNMHVLDDFMPRMR